MTPKADLFQLIKSLTQTEKRYFKVYTQKLVSKNSKSNSTELFDAIESMHEFDEEKLKKKIKNKSIVNHLPSEKNYLLHSILKVLRAYHTGSINTQLNEMLRDIELLKNKGMYKQAIDISKKSIMLAEKYEKYILQVEIIAQLKQLYYDAGSTDEEEEDIDTLYEKEISALKKINNISDYSNLRRKLNLLQKKLGTSRKPDDIRKYKELINHPLLLSEKNAITFNSLSSYYTIHSVYSIRSGNFKKGYDYCLKHMDLYNKNPKLKMEYPEKYIYAINNTIAVCKQMGKHKEFLQHLTTLRNVQSTSLDCETKIFFRSYNFEISHYNQLGYFEKAVELIPKITEGLEKYRHQLPEEFQLVFYLQFAKAYFGTESFSKSLQYLNLILNNNSRNRQDIYCFAKILNLIVHYELGNTDFIEHAARNTRRYLQSKNRLQHLENIILDFIKKLSAADNIKTKFYFKKFQAELEASMKEPLEKAFMDYFDIMSWLKSKIENKSYAEIIKKGSNVNE